LAHSLVLLRLLLFVAGLDDATAILLAIREHHVDHLDGLVLVELQLSLGHQLKLLQHAVAEALGLVLGVLLVQHHLDDVLCGLQKFG